MLYNSLKYFHVLSAALLIGGQLFLMLIMPKIRDIKSNLNLKLPRYLLLIALLGVICTGIILVDIAGMEYGDFWIKHALMALSFYIILNAFLHKFANNKLLWWVSWFLLQVILILMIFKPEF